MLCCKPMQNEVSVSEPAQQQVAVTQQTQQQSGAPMGAPMAQQTTNTNVTNIMSVSGLPPIGPAWLPQVEVAATIGKYGFDVTGNMGHSSEKMQVRARDIVVRFVQKTDVHTGDGARIMEPLNSGKHVFEIEWAKELRGSLAAIGVAIGKTPMQMKGKTCLVGDTSTSWGFDIARRNLINNKKVLNKRYPEMIPEDRGIHIKIPDTFYAFLDMDPASGGVLSFGSADRYYGEAFIDLIRIVGNEPLYLTVGTNTPGAHIRCTYKGSYTHAIMQSERDANVALMNALPSNTGHTQVQQSTTSQQQQDTIPVPMGQPMGQPMQPPPYTGPVGGPPPGPPPAGDGGQPPAGDGGQPPAEQAPAADSGTTEQL